MELFDSYGRQARLFPGLLTIFPPLLAALAWFPELVTSSLGATLLTVASSCGLLYALSSLARSRGKALEPKLVSKWGGWPTTLLLRHTGPLDPHTLARYHAYLTKNIKGLVFPTMHDEQENLLEADLAYQSAVKWLKEKTRGKQYKMITRENIQYGFRRNLLGMKPLGIAACVTVLFASALAILIVKPDVQIAFANGTLSPLVKELKDLGPTIIGSIFVNCLAIVGWVLVVNEMWVKSAAFHYAEALLASCDAPKK